MLSWGFAMGTAASTVELQVFERELASLLDDGLKGMGQRPVGATIARRALEEFGNLDPTDGDHRRRLVDGPIRRVVERMCGTSVAARMVDFLRMVSWVTTAASSGIPVRIPSAPPVGIDTATTYVVLVVSSDYGLRQHLEDLLAANDYVVVTARDAAEAISCCRIRRPALMLCDVDTCDAFGSPAHHIIGEHLGTGTPPIVLLVDSAAEMGVASRPMLSKTLDPMRVLELVAESAGVPSAPPRHASDVPPPAESSEQRLPARAFASPYAPLVGEALELVAAPQARNQILLAALDTAGLDAIPADKQAFARFASGPLHAAVTRFIGEDAADAVLEDLQSTSGLHRRDMLVQPPSQQQRSSTRVLLAATDPDFRSVVTAALRSEGHEVTATDSGREALSIALRERPDVLVADLELAGLSGREVAGLLKRMHQDAAPALVFVDPDGAVAGEVPGLGQVLPADASVAEVVAAVSRALAARTAPNTG